MVTLEYQPSCALPAQEDKANVSCSPRVAFSLTQLPWDAVGGPHQAKHLHKVTFGPGFGSDWRCLAMFRCWCVSCHERFLRA